MALESASYISGLVSTNPSGSDAISQGDDHLRLIKTVLKASLPNAYEAVNGIHTGGTAPTSTSAGQLWFDTSNNLLKMRNEADSGWINMSASEGSRLLDVTHDIESSTGSFRSNTYVNTGWSVTHTCLSATSNLYIHVDGGQQTFSSWDSGSQHQYGYIRLANTSGVLITGTTDNILIADMKDSVGSGLSTNEFGAGFSHTWKVIPANRPDTPSAVGSNTFNIFIKTPQSGAGGTTLFTGNFMVWEIEE